MASAELPNQIETVVIGGGQAGLSVGYHLAQRSVPFVILDAHDRVGDIWRERWDSLHLFTPARFDGLAGMPFPAPPFSFPAKNEMADYLERYAAHFGLPVCTGTKVTRLARIGELFSVTTTRGTVVARQVVVAMSSYQVPRLPDVARQLDPSIVQLHSLEYKSPAQLRDGPLLVVGAGNSGAEIAKENARGRQVWLSGRDTGHLPFKVDGPVGRRMMRVILRGFFHRVATIDTPIGRKLRPKVLAHGGPLIRVKPRELAALGVARVPRLSNVTGGMPVLEDGTRLEVGNVIWCTGFEPGFSWIALPIFDATGAPRHTAGISVEPGLYFVGLHFLYAFSSTMIHGVGRDAARIARAVAAQTGALVPPAVLTVPSGGSGASPTALH
jgi:putative flavoprotein involved in K+ transport